MTDEPTPATPAVTGAEAIARIIDPWAFANWQNLYDDCVAAGDPEESARGTADHMHGKVRVEALAKAHEVIALARLTTEATRPMPEDVAGLVEALEQIRDLDPRPYDGPGFDRKASDACPECQSYVGHPIQHGICSEHRRPQYAREAHDAHEEKILGYRCKAIARDALTALSAKPASAGVLADQTGAAGRVEVGPDHPLYSIGTRCKMCGTAAPEAFARECDRPECPHRAAKPEADQSGGVERLRAHVAEQITFAESRIQDGKDICATAWRIALEDIARENRAALKGPPHAD